MIKGIGTDIIEIKRVGLAFSRHGNRFLNRIFTPKEQAYCLQHNRFDVHLAGRFAAKEAIVKALGTGFRGGISWLDIEISNDSSGKPCVEVSKHLKDILGLDSFSILVSISHSRDYATAFAIVTLQ